MGRVPPCRAQGQQQQDQTRAKGGGGVGYEMDKRFVWDDRFDIGLVI